MRGKKLIKSQAATQAAIFSGFQSREPNASLQKTQKDKKLLRRRRTGRTAQFNLKTCPETITAFYHIADQQGLGA